MGQRRACDRQAVERTAAGASRNRSCPRSSPTTTGASAFPMRRCCKQRSFDEARRCSRRWPRSAPIEIGIVGDIDEQLAIDAVANSFGALPHAGRRTPRTMPRRARPRSARGATPIVTDPRRAGRPGDGRHLLADRRRQRLSPGDGPRPACRRARPDADRKRPRAARRFLWRRRSAPTCRTPTATSGRCRSAR